MNSLSKVIVLFAILGIVGAGLFFYPGSPFYYKNNLVIVQTEDEDTDAIESGDIQLEEESISSQEETPSESDIIEDEDANASAEAVAQTMVVDVTDMTLGSDDAPITIYEYSSLSCSHCGAFHSEVYPQIKTDFIETGKVKLVMIDFPLNLPAMQGAMIAHCLPEDQYFNFLQLLFTTQQNWLSGDYEANLRQNAQLAGLNSDQIDTCLGNEELEEKLIARMEEAQGQWNISSTPSFVINDGQEIIEGNRPFSEFETIFNKILSASENKEE